MHDSFASCNKGHIRSLSHGQCAPALAFNAGVVEVVHGRFAKSQINWMGSAARGSHSGAGFHVVGWNHDFNIVYRTEGGQIMQRMMRRAERTIAYAGANAD